MQAWHTIENAADARLRSQATHAAHACISYMEKKAYNSRRVYTSMSLMVPNLRSNDPRAVFSSVHLFFILHEIYKPWYLVASVRIDPQRYGGTAV